MFYTARMDWDLAIERNCEPLLRIVLALFALIGFGEGSVVERLAWPLYRAVLRVLRPAEWAVRRLIVIAARDLVAKPSPVRKAKPGRKIAGKRRSGRISFRLFDPRKRFDRLYRPKGPRAEPRIHFFNFDPRSPLVLRQAASVAPSPPQLDRTTVSAKPLCRRLAAIKHALEDLAAQARRYARWRDKPFETRRPKLASTLRPGPPPRFRSKPAREADAILRECHWLARNLPKPDTS
jgi:hypothetical protein